MSKLLIAVIYGVSTFFGTILFDAILDSLILNSVVNFLSRVIFIIVSIFIGQMIAEKIMKMKKLKKNFDLIAF